MGSDIIYHIVKQDDFIKHTSEGSYTPSSYDADGFIHCTGDEQTSLLVLKDYFSGVPEAETILVLKIDTALLDAEVRFEDPAPAAGAGTTHMKDGLLFPHVYGSINLSAVTGAGRVERNNGAFLWPAEFTEPGTFLS